MAKPNYEFEKRRRELEKKKKMEEKRLRKLEKSHAGDAPAEGQPEGGEAGSATTPPSPAKTE